ncbi:MAG: DUF4173 domain-containing protein [Verrucomicrobiales bacterium]|nr:DUF4173 domain-containing protein [Verrucomicrobiales bacterium]
MKLPLLLPDHRAKDPLHPQAKAANSTCPWQLLTSILLLTIAADLLSFGFSLGISITLLFALIWGALRWNRPSKPTDWKDLLLYTLMTVTALQAAIENSFSNWLILFLLTSYASGHFLHRHIAPYWRRALEGLFGMLNLYLAYFNLKRSLTNSTQAKPQTTFASKLLNLRRYSMIALPAVLLTITFLILFSQGNALIGNQIHTLITQLCDWLATIQLPSLPRILFWITAACLSLTLLSQSPLSSDLARIAKKLPQAWAAPADLNASIWSTRLLLIAVNVIFFTANTSDVIYLWLETQLPAGVNFSAYVHHGVYNLIACVALAAGVLLVLFQQDPQVTKASGQKLLAHLWIAQNLLLVTSVLLRLKLYVDTYHLSLLRLYVAFFLALVVIGFVLLAIKIHQQRRFSWLLNSNLLAIFLLFFCLQTLNDHAFVARYNYQQSRLANSQRHPIDLDYLIELGPPAWPTLKKIANDKSHFGHIAQQANQHLHAISQNEKLHLANSDWRSWQFRRWSARQSLPDFEPQKTQLSYSSRQ